MVDGRVRTEVEYQGLSSEPWPMHMNEISVFGIKITSVDTTAALEAIEGFVREREPRMVVTADSSAVVLAQKDPELMEIINGADLVTPDSIGILLAARRLGTPLPERVSGVDVLESLCERAASAGYRVFLLGAAPGVADAAAEKLRQRYVGLQVVGTQHGFFASEESPSVVRKIRETEPDILFVAMGIPLQEKWISAHLQDLEIPVSMGVGGTFDVVSGRVKRAPQWIQRCGMEWCYRLASNPRKIRKCMTLPVFALMLLRAGKRKDCRR